ncbi:MAG: hypothetical protein AAF226_10425 [Verrucomicrobiota bacterium]
MKKALLIVGCVIAVLLLIGILVMPIGAKTAIEAAKTAAAKTDANNLRVSVLSFLAEYRSFPFEVEPEKQIKSEPYLMNILMATKASEENPREIVFYSGRPARVEAGAPVHGVHSDGADNYSLYDPWGSLFRVVFDSDDDNRIAHPFSGASIGARVLVWSPGPDGIDGTDDDVKSWE